ncbi:MAG: glycosyltransferase, partial [Chitinophagaceae bacterium]
VLIPSFKEDLIIVNTARQALLQNYPSHLYEVIIIADHLKRETIDSLLAIPVKVITVEFEVSTKAKSLQVALQSLSSQSFNIAVILDADNIMREGCLNMINDAFQSGCQAVQCHRVSKNLVSPISFLEAISEEININLFRRGPSVLGLSAAPMGSGMAIEFHLLKEIFNTKGLIDNPGEDREIDIQLMKRNIRMEFIDAALVYDEKAEKVSVFEKQRVRWLEAQFNHARRFLAADVRSSPKTAIYFHRLFQTFLLPKLLYLAIFMVIAVLAFLQRFTETKWLSPSTGWWLACLLLYALILFLSIPIGYYNAKMLRALAYIPVLMVSMFKAVFKMKRNRKEFLHTSKTIISK